MSGRRVRSWSVVALAFALAGFACSSCTPPPVYPSNAAKCGSSATPPSQYQHIVVIMEENRTWDGVGGIGFADQYMPYLGDLGRNCTVFADWVETNTDQNSLNQYIGLASGVSNSSTVNDCSPGPSCQSTDNNIFRQVRLAGGTARSYVEGASTGCSDAGNAAKHVPAMYFYGTYTDGSGTHNDHDFCGTEVRPLSELDVNNLPTFAMITPDLCNDGHDCLNASVDSWVASHLQPILDSSAYQSGNTAVMVLYDEDRPVPNLLIAPTANRGVNTTAGAGHAAMLKTWEEMLGLPIMPTAPVTAAISLRGPAHI
ncbi:MAG: alkaline phosphatase family protein [Acidimicrobiales bacterium]